MAKKTVDLAGGPVRVSRIRRDPPPPPPRRVTPGELREQEARVIVAGLFAAGLALSLLLYHVAQWAGWSPTDYHIVVHSQL
jgi:hypothetical protein